MKPKYLKLLINIYPPSCGTGIVVRHISPDYRRIDVQMKMHWYNRNYVKTHFGGSLYAMCDPFFMLMLLQILGPDYLVWDKAAHIEFVAPGKGPVTAVFQISEHEIEAILRNTQDGKKYYPTFTVVVRDTSLKPVAKITNTLYIKRKD